MSFTFHGSEAGDSFQCSLDGAPWASCASPQQYTSLAEGPHTFDVRAINAAGEVDPTPATASFTVEATPPETTITSAPSGRIPTGAVSISFTSDEAGSTFKCSLDGAAYAPCASPYKIAAPAAGPHTFMVEATNQAGVSGSPAPEVSWSSVEAQHDLCGTLATNTTIGPDYAARYIITCTTEVPKLATLTAEPGTIIKADQSTKLSVEGALKGVGTASEPITFTSVNDNSVGGDTGSGTPAAGDWQGIEVSGAGSVTMTSSAVSYAYTGLAGTTSGSVSVVDGRWATFVSGGLAVSAGAVTVRDSTVLDSGTVAPAFSVASGALNLDQLTGNSATGGVPAFFVSGTVSTNSTWHSEPAPWLLGPAECGSGLTIAAGVTVTVEPGTVIKGGEKNYLGNCGGPGGVLTVLGTLDAAGTEAEPIVFTSVNDNSVGGDTGSGSPAAGDWEGIKVEEEGSVSFDHVRQSFAGVTASFQESGEDGTLSVTNSVFFDTPGTAVGYYGYFSSHTPVISDNVVEGMAGSGMPIVVSSQDIDLDELDGNTATGGTPPALGLAGTINQSSTLPIGGLTPVAVVGGFTGGFSLTIASGTTVTLPAGSILKVQKAVSGYGILVEGSLVADGTAGSPVQITSINDNSVGGETGSGSPAPGDWEGIDVNSSGSVALEHTNVSYASTGLTTSTSGSVMLMDDIFGNNADEDVFGEMSGVASITGSRFSVPAGTGSAIHLAAADPTVQDNVVSDAGSSVSAAVAVESSTLNVSHLDDNTITGTGDDAFAITGTIVTSGTLPAESYSWVIAENFGNGDTSELDVASGVKLTVAAGAVVKARGGGEFCGDQIARCSLVIEGTLDAVGTMSEPITFTSINDNSVGGETGSGSPAPGDWEGIDVAGSGSVDLEHDIIDYAATALNFDASTALLSDVAISHSGGAAINATSGTVSFRGTLSDDPAGIRACDWGTESCSVDAAYTYWGSSEGPFPKGEPDLACGAVTTSPYRPSEAGEGTTENSDFGVHNCDASLTPSEQLASAEESYGEFIAGEEIQCGEGFEEVCEVIKQTEECLSAATTLAQESSPFTFSNGSKDVASNGADWLASSETRVVSDVGQAASFALGIVGAAQTILDIANAYSQCG